MLILVATILTAAVACKASGKSDVAGVVGAGGANSGCAASGGRYEILDPGNQRESYSIDCPKVGSGCDGSGLVMDSKTGLVWLRFEYFPVNPDSLIAPDPGQNQIQASTYCANREMRLPTVDEALGIAGENYSKCVWQPYWATWTSIPPGSRRALVIRNDGSTLDLDVDIDGAPALCVE